MKIRLKFMAIMLIMAMFTLGGCGGGGGGGGDNDPGIAVTGVTLNKISTTISVGSYEQITATITPANATSQNVFWSSSDSSVATVTAGLVIPYAAGTTEITATSADGGHTASCVVTVTNSGTGTGGVSAADLTLGISAYVNGTISATTDNGSNYSDPYHIFMKMKNSDASVKIEYDFVSNCSSVPLGGNGSYIFTNYNYNGTTVNGTLSFYIVYNGSATNFSYVYSGTLTFSGNVNYSVNYDYVYTYNSGSLTFAGYWKIGSQYFSYDSSGAVSTTPLANAPSLTKPVANTGSGCSGSYTVTYDANGATDGSEPNDFTNYTDGATVTVLGNSGSLVRSGYTFGGWNTQANGSGTTYTTSQTFTMGSENVTLYAVWNSIPTYTVTYDGNGATGGIVPVDNTNYTQSQNVTVLGNTGSLLKSGSYAFAGWNTQANGLGTTYTSGQTFTMGTVNVILYAKWNPAYTVTYSANGATGGIVPVDSTNYNQSQNVTVLGNTGSLTRSGYTFGGWNTQANGLGTTYTMGQTFAMGTVNVILYAKWNPAYTVTYSANGATGGIVPFDSTNYTQSQNVTVLDNTGSLVKMQDGISLLFGGWNTQANGLGTTYTMGQTFAMGTANVILYAKWSILRCTGPAGGLVFYDKGSYSGTPSWRYLEAAPVSTEWSGKQWGSYGSLIGGTGTAIGTGRANTTAIVTWLNANSETGRAAQLCDALISGGYSDWFLPSKDEFNQAYLNLHLHSYGVFASNLYWNSSESIANSAWFQGFYNGAQEYGNKSTTMRVRAIRAF